MKHLDQYLKTIGTFLPKEQKEDILKELSENILSKIEDSEAELGRPLNEAEQEAIIKGYGNPMLVASRYGPETGGVAFGQQLISPALFQLYIKILSLNIAIAFAIVIILLVVLRLSIPAAFSAFTTHALIQFAIVTFIFALAQNHFNNHPDQWDVLNPKAPTTPEVKTGPRVSRFESVLQIIVLSIFASALQGVLASPNLIFAPFQPAPLWYQLYIPLMLFQVIGIAQATISLFRPDWVRFQAATQVGIEIASLIILGILLTAGNWVVLVDPTANTAGELQTALKFINQYLFYGLIISCMVSIVQLVTKVRHLLRTQRLVS